MERSLARLSNVLDQLGDRGGLYIQPFNYQTLVAFISGYDLAVAESDGKGLLERFREWLHNRVGQHCSMSWAAVIRAEIAEKDEDQAVRVLIRLFRDFIRESKSDAFRT
jgi:hypothetical protein